MRIAVKKRYLKKVILALILFNYVFANGEMVEDIILKIKEVLKEEILYYYYWHRIYYTEEEKDKLYPYNKRIPIKIIIMKDEFYILIDYKLRNKGGLYIKSEEWREVYVGNITREGKEEKYKIRSCYKLKNFKKKELFNNPKNYISSYIILPSDWEPKYPAVEGKKKEMVEKIKRLVKRYFFRFVIKKEDDFKEIMNEKITIYIRDFYLWEEGSEIIIVSDKSSFLGNLSFYDAIEGKFIEGEYDEWTCLTPTKWKFPKNFKLENYKGGDEFLRKFAKHYIKEEIQITKEDIEQWQRKHQKKHQKK